MAERAQYSSHDNLQDIKSRLVALEESNQSLQVLAKYSRVRVFVAYAILAATAIMFLLVFTALGDWVGFKTGWLISNAGGPNAPAQQANTESVLSATRNMITVIGPILLGTVVWLITITAERRLKAYDDAMQNFRGEIRDGIGEARETTLATVQGSIKEQVREAIETEKDRMDDAIDAYRTDLQVETNRVEEIRDSIEDRFGHIADSAAYSKSDSDFGELTSVGAVYKKVGALFREGDRAQAVLMVRELLDMYHRKDGRHRSIASPVGDWFNLSTVLGREDEESLALEICLSGLQQQAGVPVFDESGQLANGIIGQSLDDDLLAHAIQYAQTVSDPRLAGLLNLNGYDAEKCTGQPEWGWRSYAFTIRALASIGRHDEAIRLGQNYLKTVPLDGDTNKVVQELITVMAAHGDRKGAIDQALEWLEENPYAPGAQVLTNLMDWLDADENVDRYIDLASRGIRDLAEEQPSSNLSNFYYRRALARDKRALDAALGSPHSDLGICDEIRLALSDYQMALEIDGLSPNLMAQISQRQKVLHQVAREKGCDEGDLPSSDSNRGSGDASDDLSDAVRQQIVHLLPIITNGGMQPLDKANTIQEALSGQDPVKQKLTYAFLAHMMDDDDVPAELRAALRELWPHISAVE